MILDIPSSVYINVCIPCMTSFETSVLLVRIYKNKYTPICRCLPVYFIITCGDKRGQSSVIYGWVGAQTNYYINLVSDSGV